MILTIHIFGIVHAIVNTSKQKSIFRSSCRVKWLQNPLFIIRLNSILTFFEMELVIYYDMNLFVLNITLNIDYTIINSYKLDRDHFIFWISWQDSQHVE